MEDVGFFALHGKCIFLTVGLPILTNQYREIIEATFKIFEGAFV